MVDDPVDDGGGHVVITEDGSPAGELEVRRQDQGLLLVGLRDDPEQGPIGDVESVSQRAVTRGRNGE